MLKSVFFLLSIVLFAPTTHGQSEQAVDWILLERTNFSMEIPTNWELDESKQMGTSFILYSQFTHPKDRFKENVNLFIQDLAEQEIDLKTFTEISVGQVETYITNAEIIESSEKKANGLNFQKLVYTGEQGVFQLRFEQYFWVENGSAYVLTFTSEKNQFDSFEEVGHKIMDSFILTL